MAWDADMLTILRALVADLDSTRYTDDTLEQTLLVAAFQVGNEQLKFTQQFQVNFTAGNMLPDPTLTATKDDSYVNLVTLKAACIIDQGAAVLAAQQAIAVGDGSSRIDLRERSVAFIKLLEKGYCAVYEKAKYEFQTGQTRVAGAAVMTPFRLYAFGLSGGRVNRSINHY